MANLFIPTGAFPRLRGWQTIHAGRLKNRGYSRSRGSFDNLFDDEPHMQRFILDPVSGSPVRDERGGY
jgi:hypothetical protein